ncbi:hypothetical protein HDU81_005250 [Chytriomyces hyalinus]|nr:hypothetical protein HDU81_005250 [Chytriomyces hyalinus]
MLHFAFALFMIAIATAVSIAYGYAFGHALAVTVAATLSPSSAAVPATATAQSASTDTAVAVEPTSSTRPSTASSITLSALPVSTTSTRTNASSQAHIGNPNSDKSIQISQAAGPPTDKSFPLLKLASPVFAKSAITAAKPSLSSNSTDLPAATFSRTTSADTSVTTQLPSQKLAETVATKPTSTPVKMTEAAKSSDLISQGLAAPVPSPVVALSLPVSTSTSPLNTITGPLPNALNQSAEKRVDLPLAVVVSPPVTPLLSAPMPTLLPATVSQSSAELGTGPSKSSLPAEELSVETWSGSAVPLPHPDKEELDFFATDEMAPQQMTMAVKSTHVDPTVSAQPAQQLTPPLSPTPRSITLQPEKPELEQKKASRPKLVPKRLTAKQRSATLEGMMLNAELTEAQKEPNELKAELPTLEGKRVEIEVAQPTGEMDRTLSKAEQTVEGDHVLPTLPVPTVAACVPIAPAAENGPSTAGKKTDKKPSGSPAAPAQPASPAVKVSVKPVSAAAAPVITGTIIVPTTETAASTAEAVVGATKEDAVETPTTFAQPEPVASETTCTKAPAPASQKEVDPAALERKREAKVRRVRHNWTALLDEEVKMEYTKLASELHKALNSAADPMNLLAEMDVYFRTTGLIDMEEYCTVMGLADAIEHFKEVGITVRSIETCYQLLLEIGFEQSSYVVPDLLPNVLQVLPEYFIFEH